MSEDLFHLIDPEFKNIFDYISIEMSKKARSNESKIVELMGDFPGWLIGNILKNSETSKEKWFCFNWLMQKPFSQYPNTWLNEICNRMDLPTWKLFVKIKLPELTSEMINQFPLEKQEVIHEQCQRYCEQLLKIQIPKVDPNEFSKKTFQELSETVFELCRIGGRIPKEFINEELQKIYNEITDSFVALLRTHWELMNFLVLKMKATSNPHVLEWIDEIGKNLTNTQETLLIFNRLFEEILPSSRLPKEGRASGKWLWTNLERSGVLYAKKSTWHDNDHSIQPYEKRELVEIASHTSKQYSAEYSSLLEGVKHPESLLSILSTWKKEDKSWDLLPKLALAANEDQLINQDEFITLLGLWQVMLDFPQESPKIKWKYCYLGEEGVQQDKETFKNILPNNGLLNAASSLTKTEIGERFFSEMSKKKGLEAAAFIVELSNYDKIPSIISSIADIHYTTDFGFFIGIPLQIGEESKELSFPVFSSTGAETFRKVAYEKNYCKAISQIGPISADDINHEQIEGGRVVNYFYPGTSPFYFPDDLWSGFGNSGLFLHDLVFHLNVNACYSEKHRQVYQTLADSLMSFFLKNSTEKEQKLLTPFFTHFAWEMVDRDFFSAYTSNNEEVDKAIVDAISNKIILLFNDIDQFTFMKNEKKKKCIKVIFTIIIKLFKHKENLFAIELFSNELDKMSKEGVNL